MWRKKLSGVLFAGMLSAVIAPAPAIAADGSGTYVGFGDSMAANPTILDIAMVKAQGKIPEAELPVNTPGNGCAQGDDSFGRRVSEQTGLELHDYSCPGATAYTTPTPVDSIPHTMLSEQVDQAIAEGSLNGDTKLVSVIAGVNDVYQNSNMARPQEERMRLYHDVVTAQINRIREHAPNAQIVMVGYPDETDGGAYTCGSNLFGVTSHWYFPFVAYYQDEIREEQRAAAEATNIPFIDMVAEINVENNNSGCQNLPPEQRYMATIVDDGGQHNLSAHLTSAGNQHYADRISSYYQQ